VNEVSTPSAVPTIRVWDRAVRALHWSLRALDGRKRAASRGDIA
jgi:hypothetical protein